MNSSSHDRHRRIATALLADADERLPHHPNPYLVRHLSGHVAAAGMWAELAGSPVLDHLDPEALARDAFRTAFGSTDLPPEIAAVMSGHHILADLPPESRPMTRGLIARRYGPVADRASGGRPWSTRWTAFHQGSLHLVLGRHGNGVTSAATLTLPDGRTLLVTGSDDGTLQFWDPTAAAPVGAPIAAHIDGVEVVTAVELSGRVLLASGGRDATVRLWDPVAGQPVGEALTGHDGPVTAMTPVAGGQARLATGGEDGTVRFWDPLAAVQVGDPVAAHKGGVTAMSPTADGSLLVTGGADKLVQLWDVATQRPLGRPLTGHKGTVQSVTPVPAADGRTSFATCAIDGTALLWVVDAQQSASPGEPMYVGSSWCITSVPMPDGRTFLAAGGIDGSVKVWDAAGDWWSRTSLRGHATSVRTVVALSTADGQQLLASGSDDGTIRLWHPGTALPTGDSDIDRTDPVRGVLAVPLASGRTLLATQSSASGVLFHDAVTGARQELSLARWGWSMTTVALADGRRVLVTGDHDGSARLWDPADGSSPGDELEGHRYSVQVAAVEAADGQVLLATAGDEGTVRLRDPVSGKQIRRLRRVAGLSRIHAIAGVPTPRHGPLVAVAGPEGVWLWNPAKRVAGLAPLTRDPTTTGMIAVLPVDGRPLLATAHEGGPVWLWDPLLRERVGERLDGHRKEVSAMSAVRLADGRVLLATGSYDQTVRLWDPGTGASLLTIVVGHVPHGTAAVRGGLALALDAGVAVVDVHELPIRG